MWSQFGPMPLSAHRNSGDCGVRPFLLKYFISCVLRIHPSYWLAAYFTKMGMVLVSLVEQVTTHAFAEVFPSSIRTGA